MQKFLISESGTALALPAISDSDDEINLHQCENICKIWILHVCKGSGNTNSVPNLNLNLHLEKIFGAFSKNYFERSLL